MATRRGGSRSTRMARYESRRYSQFDPCAHLEPAVAQQLELSCIAVLNVRLGASRVASRSQRRDAELARAARARSGSSTDRETSLARATSIVRGMSPRFSARTPATPSRRPPSSASRVSAPIGLAELRPQAVRLLEVVADELVELGDVGQRRVEPVGVALVQLGSQPLGRRAIDRLLDEDVAEPKPAVPPRAARTRGQRGSAGAHPRSAPHSGRAARSRRQP